MNAKQHNDNLIRELYRLSRKILIPQFSTSCVYGFICENRSICLLRLYMKCFSTKCNSNKIASETFRIKIFMNGNEEELVQISFWRDASSVKQQRLVHDVESRTVQVHLFTNLYAPIHSTVLVWYFKMENKNARDIRLTNFDSKYLEGRQRIVIAHRSG